MGVPERTRPTSLPRDANVLSPTGGRTATPAGREWRTYRTGGDGRPRGRPGVARRDHTAVRQPQRPRPGGRRTGPAAVPLAKNTAGTLARRRRSTRQPSSAVSPLRLTGRGGVIVLFVVTCLGLLFSDAAGARILAEIIFVAACVLAAWYVKPRDVLTITVAPPLVFFVAVVVATVLTSSGLTTTAAGVLITLIDAAPWLFAGTALVVVIGLRRGLVGAVRDLCEAPPAPRRRAGGHRGSR